MNEQLTPGAPRRIQVLQRYMSAMENGDVDELATVLSEAEQDQALGHMILEVNEVYQQEDQTLAQPGDAALVQQILLNAIPAGSSTSIEEAAVPSLNGNAGLRDTDLHLETISETGTGSRDVATPLARVAAPRKTTVQVLPSPRATSRKWYRTRRSWLVAAVVAVLIALVLFPTGGVLANQLFSFFRVQQFQPIQITPGDLHTLLSRPIPTFEDLGSLQVQPGSLQTHDNLTEAQAAQMIGFSLLLPRSLPQGIPNNPTFGVMDSGHATFTFNSSQARAFFAKNGYGNVSIPANLDGATFDITTTAGVLISYGDQAETQFMVVEVPSPILSATGKASLQELRDFVLSLPGLPSQLVAQLRQIDLTSGVVPLPIPSGVNSRSITVHGTTGLLLTSDITTTIAHIKKFPAGSAVVWQAQGIIYALGGTVSDTNQLLASANSLG